VDCICDAHTDPDPTEHATDCPGVHPCGWRARMSRFVRGYTEEVIAAERMPERSFADLVVQYAGRARYGPQWQRPAA
jgi:hypothetical protein